MVKLIAACSYRLYMSAIISTSSSAASCCAFMGSISRLLPSKLCPPQKKTGKKSARNNGKIDFRVFFNLHSVCSGTRVLCFRFVCCVNKALFKPDVELARPLVAATDHYHNISCYFPFVKVEVVTPDSGINPIHLWVYCYKNKTHTKNWFKTFITGNFQFETPYFFKEIKTQTVQTLTWAQSSL